MAKRGRPRKPGKRYASGRLVVPVDRGNDKVQARADAFSRFQDGKADQQIGDQIGRAWAAGLLDGLDFDAAILRDAGRRYGNLYWHEFAALAPKMGASERSDRGVANDSGEDPAGDLFRSLDDLARSAGLDALTAMHALCVNEWWFPDTNQPWVDRLINQARLRAGISVAGELATDRDWALLAAAKAALLAMVQGRNPRLLRAFPLLSAGA